jgi:hypothetical protein
MDSTETTSSAPDTSAQGVCPVCRTPAVEDSIECPDCHVRHHQECWVYNNGCGKYGCASAPASEKLNELEVPPSFWGQNEKECPACHKLIQAAALRCRHCGTVFNTARPQDVVQFHAQRSLTSDLPGLKRNVIILLIFSALPCTAPLAAVVGGIWYLTRREKIAQLPATQSAMAKIALGIAIGQTTLLVLVAILHSMFAE